MAAEFITPIQPLTFGPSGIVKSSSETEKETGASLFKDIFANAINDAKAKEEDLENKQYLLVTGQIDDAHTVPIAASEAQLSIDYLVQLRNKAVEAYNELMQMSI